MELSNLKVGDSISTIHRGSVRFGRVVAYVPKTSVAKGKHYWWIEFGDADLDQYSKVVLKQESVLKKI